MQLKDLSDLKVDQAEKNLNVAKEELFEALILRSFIKNRRLTMEQGKIRTGDFNSYIGGVMDFCGELVRKARTDAIETGSAKLAKKYLGIIVKVQEGLSEYAFTNASGNRSKIENLKSYREALEGIEYDHRSTHPKSRSGSKSKDLQSLQRPKRALD